ncbi:MAG: FABP family protein [Candidatus Nanopelagicales bacterium]|nr:FABP family protein [Candidatus Nanopelagicales bacterium]MDZ4249046.1 FABP family protein [Candidatus Nanopelagicales bacterium]
MSEALPQELIPLSWLIGRWVGVGTGHYPTIEDFRFGQELGFVTDGRPFLSYWSRSWVLDDQGNRIRKAATEVGFVRPGPDGSLELLLAHPTGFTEIWEGSVEVTEMSGNKITGARADLRTDLVARTHDAKPYTAGHRLYGLVDGDLMWTFDMAAMGLPLQNHLAARLRPDLPVGE